MKIINSYAIDGFTVSIFDELDSTNNYLKRAAEDGAPDGSVAVALTQTGGKGRLGRSFFSPKSGLYLSVLVRRNIEVGLAHLITPMAAVAVASSLEKCGSETAEIKWVNDIYIGGRKVCGILTETQISPSGKTLGYAVIGIGINLAEPDGGFPADIKNRAGAAFKNADDGIRERLASKILRELERGLSSLSGKGFLEEYRSRSILIGRDIEIITGNTPIAARVIGIDDDCKLIAETAEGIREIYTGEVSIKM